MIVVIFAGCATNADDSRNGEDNQAVQNGDAVAIVNGSEISRADFDEELEQMRSMMGIEADDEESEEMLQQATLDQMITLELLSQRSEEAGYYEDSEEVEEQVSDQIEQLKEADSEAFQDYLDSFDLTEEALREQLAEQLAIQLYLEEEIGEIDVSEEEVEEYFEMISEGMEEGEEEIDFEMIRPEIENQLMREKSQEKQMEIVENIRSESEIEILI